VVVSLFSGELAVVLGLLFAGGACWLTQNAFNLLAIEPPATATVAG
jgi:hypothetical protein